MCRAKRFFVQFMDFAEISRPTRILWQCRAFLKDKTLEFFDAKLRYQKLDARPVAILLFAESGKYTRNGLRGRQQFFFRQETVKQLGLMWNCSQSTANVQLKAALLDAALRVHFLDCDHAHVVHVDKPTGFVFAARERDLELATEVLYIRVTQQKVRESLGIRCDVE